MYYLAQKNQTRYSASLHYTHSVFIPDLCDALPLIDLFYKRMLNFVFRYLNSQSFLVNFVTCHGIISGQMSSVLGRNVINCSLSYKTTVEFISSGEVLCY